LSLNTGNAPHEGIISQNPVGLHDLRRTVREPQLSCADVNSAVFLFFVLMMHTRPSAVQVSQKIVSDMSPIQQQFRLIFPQHLIGQFNFIGSLLPQLNTQHKWATENSFWLSTTLINRLSKIKPVVETAAT
jgi:hypothetical protein